MDIGEMVHKDKNKKTYMVLLDWEKAFDKVRHEALYVALDRLNF